MTAGRTTERGGSSELKDNLEIIGKKQNRRWATSHASVAREFKSEDSWAELLLDAEIKLPADAAE